MYPLSWWAGMSVSPGMRANKQRTTCSTHTTQHPDLISRSSHVHTTVYSYYTQYQRTWSGCTSMLAKMRSKSSL